MKIKKHLPELIMCAICLIALIFYILHDFSSLVGAIITGFMLVIAIVVLMAFVVRVFGNENPFD